VPIRVPAIRVEPAMVPYASARRKTVPTVGWLSGATCAGVVADVLPSPGGNRVIMMALYIKETTKRHYGLVRCLLASSGYLVGRGTNMTK
jgi:hypothetical protein